MIPQIFSSLYEHYGDQNWWPADSAFEIMVGAILTQNTNWTNVEKALQSLRDRQALDPQVIMNTPQDELAQWIRSSGYYNMKAERLQTLCRWYIEQGGFDALSAMKTVELRAALLSLKGVGPETADDILLYGFKRAVFIIDTYTRRLYSRIGLFSGDESYDELQHMIEISLDYDAELFAEYHALIISHGKEFCKATPACEGCPLTDLCISTTQT